MSVFKTLEERISEALSLYPTSSDNVVRDPPTDDQVTQQPSQPEDTRQSQASQTESVDASQDRSGEQSPWKPASEDRKGEAADTAADRLNTEFGEVRLVYPQKSADSQPTESGAQPSDWDTKPTPDDNTKPPPDSTPKPTPDDNTKPTSDNSNKPTPDSNTKPAAPAPQEQPERTKEPVPATPPSTPQDNMSSNYWRPVGQSQGNQKTQQDRNPLKPSINSATKEMRDSSGAQAQGGNREYQPICSSKTFTTIVDQPLEKEIIEVIREHRFYEKKFVVETRPAGERELPDRQNEEELGTRVVMGRVTAPSGPCEKAPELVVHSR
ncbi:g2565 [Coccomyxa viridis]|uniref:G2565 protein n=1 Tax=Coccomyxa viridis TaxID=1274662 RepID=A0ABP1FKP5_9CHLO